MGEKRTITWYHRTCFRCPRDFNTVKEKEYFCERHRNNRPKNNVIHIDERVKNESK